MITSFGANIFCNAYICKNNIAVGDVVDIEGNQNTSSMSNTAFNFKSYGSSSGSVKMVYGGGDTPETADDNALADPIGAFEYNGSANYNNGKYVVTATATYTGSDPITVKEIGIIVKQSGGQQFLVARKVVPPRTVQPNETFTYSMTVNFKGAE